MTIKNRDDRRGLRLAGCQCQDENCQPEDVSHVGKSVNTRLDGIWFANLYTLENHLLIVEMMQAYIVHNFLDPQK